MLMFACNGSCSGFALRSPSRFQFVKNAFHPLQFVQFPDRIGCARPRSNMVHCVAYKLHMLQRHSEGSEETSSPVTVGETTDVVHVGIGLIGLVGQNEGRTALVCPGCCANSPLFLVISVGVNDEWNSSSHRLMKMVAAVKVGHHTQHIDLAKACPNRSVSGKEDGFFWPIAIQIFFHNGRPNQHHILCFLKLMHQRSQRLPSPIGRPAQGLSMGVLIACFSQTFGAVDIGGVSPTVVRPHLVLNRDQGCIAEGSHDALGAGQGQESDPEVELHNPWPSPPTMPVPQTPPPLADEVTLARYPFLPQASDWIRNMAVRHGIDLNELLEGPWMEQARQRARIRLIDSVQSKEGVQVVGGDIHTEEGRLIEAFSFYYARLVMCASEDERLIARWAQAEAARAEQLLIQDAANLPSVARTYLTEVEETTGRAASSSATSGMNMRQLRQTSFSEWRVGLADFIEICPKITGSRWRLPNVDVEKGWVKLHGERQYASSAKLARLLRERIKAGIEAEALEKMAEVTTDLAVRLAEPVGMVRNLMANKASEAIALVGAEESDWPPCMQKIIADLAGGVNVNHFGRLFLASMSATLALPEESCVNFFRGAPDFSEATTSYQVQHVYQHEYTPAGCGKLKVNHNCPVLPGDNRTCDQPWMDHPLKYIRATQRWKRLTDRSDAPSSTPKSEEKEATSTDEA